jgi:hypothetical protein
MNPDQVESWARESNALMRERYGNRWEWEYSQASMWLAERPALQKQLAETGIAAHPHVVMSLIRAARKGRGLLE